MDIKCYLAMTSTEFYNNPSPPKHMAWMACHFSSYSSGISNKPKDLPAGSILILNDRIPPMGHDKLRIAEELAELISLHRCSGVLLDFQQKENKELEEVAKVLTDKLTVPTGVSEAYARDLNCPVFLNTPPLQCSISEIIDTWQDRTMWMEIATDEQLHSIAEQDTWQVDENTTNFFEKVFRNDELHCSYSASLRNNKPIITLKRTFEDLTKMISDANAMGIEIFIGLYQQLKYHFK